MPPAIGLMSRLVDVKEELQQEGGRLILMVDHPTQIDCLKEHTVKEPWMVYLKLDIGSK